MGRRARLVLSVALALLATHVAGSAAQIRGIDPAHASYYTGEGGIFTCLDGSWSIPFDRVNDNYCDCADGTDEPGTSACHNGRFYCANRGYEPKSLSSSFVDDGVCDCCDGADELTGCTNTCLEKSAIHRQAAREEVNKYARALESKRQFIDQAKEKKHEWTHRSGTIDQEIAAQESLIRDLESLKAKVEEAAAARREAAAAAPAPAEESQQQEVAAGAESQDANQGEAAQEETAEERGRRIAAQWTHDPEAAGVPAQAQEQHDEQLEHADHYAPQEHYEEGQGEDHEVALAEQQVQEARERLTEMQREKDNMERYNRGGFDFGPNDVFLSLAGRCLADRSNRWVYEACFFDKATQSEPYNPNNKVVVGRWLGWDNNYTEAVFAGGDPCAPPAPARSYRIRLVCGEDEQLYSSEEPATCGYTAWMITPAACQHSDLQAVQDQLAELERIEAEVAAEIAAASQPGQHDEL